MKLNRPLSSTEIANVFSLEQLKYVMTPAEVDYLMREAANRYAQKNDPKYPKGEKYIIPPGAHRPEHSMDAEFAIFKLAQALRVARALAETYRMLFLAGEAADSKAKPGDSVPEKFAPGRPPFGSDFFVD